MRWQAWSQSLWEESHPSGYQLSGNGAVSYNSHGIIFFTDFRPYKDIRLVKCWFPNSRLYADLNKYINSGSSCSIKYRNSMVKNYAFSLCEFTEIVLLAALYNKEACLRSCETKAHAHTARRSFNIRNTQLYWNPCCVSVYALHFLGRCLHLLGSGPSQSVSNKGSPESWEYSNPGDRAQPVAGAMQVKLRKRLLESWRPLGTTRPVTPPNTQHFIHH